MSDENVVAPKPDYENEKTFSSMYLNDVYPITPPTPTVAPKPTSFYQRLDRIEQENRINRIFKDRPENLHDYQGCENDAKMMKERDFMESDRQEAKRFADAFIEEVNADHTDVIRMSRDMGCRIRDHIETLRRASPSTPVSGAQEPVGHHEFSTPDGELDEVFIKKAFVHIERMDDMCFWIGIDPIDSQLPSLHIRTGVEEGVWVITYLTQVRPALYSVLAVTGLALLVFPLIHRTAVCAIFKERFLIRRIVPAEARMTLPFVNVPIFQTEDKVHLVSLVSHGINNGLGLRINRKEGFSFSTWSDRTSRLFNRRQLVIADRFRVDCEAPTNEAFFQCGRFSTVSNHDLNLSLLCKGERFSECHVLNADPSTLILMEIVDSGLQRILGSRFRRFPSQFRQFGLSVIAPLSFLKCSTGDSYGVLRCMSGGFRRGSLLMRIESVIASNKNQDYRANGFYAFRPVIWFFFAVLNIAALGFIIAAFAIFSSFDRRPYGWGWGLLRCVAIPVSIFTSWHLIWYALSLIGA